MSKYDYLRKQALNNVWQVPTIDRQFIVNPQRITKPYGRRSYFTHVWDTMSLPDTDSNWHVYDASTVPSVVLNLFTRCQGWTPLSDSVNIRGVYINAYVESGVSLPLFDTFYRYTETGVMLIAVKINRGLVMDLDRDNFYLRVYTGAYNSGQQLPPASGKVATHGVYVSSADDIDDFNAALALHTTGGNTHLYHNGIWYQDIDDIDIAVGDWIEFIYDASFKVTMDFAIGDLTIYESELDGDQKYLLHPPGNSQEVLYLDDVEFYLIQKAPDGSVLRGVYLHRNQIATVRQLTHRDMGFRTRSIAPGARVITGLTNPTLDAPIDILSIRVDVRNSGVMPGVLQQEHLRIFELYKLPNVDILRALQGIDSTVPFWTAPYLESASLAKAMGSTYNGLDVELAESLYGYNAAAKIIGDTPVKLVPGTVHDVPLPVRMQHGCTMYEYDADGLMTGWYQHLAGPTYRPRSVDTAYVEGIVGLGSDRLDQTQPAKNVTLNEVHTYRVYLGTIIGNLVQPTYTDVTGSDKYRIVDNEFTWTSTRTADYPVLMSDAKFYANDFKVRPQFGTITLLLLTQQTRPNGDGHFAMPFPMGQLDVFMNQRSLIRGLDYFLDFPRIHIINKSWLHNPQTEEQDIHVRFTGFPKANFEIESEGDVGFVEHGLLSNNNRYDIRDDKVLRIVVGGSLKHRDDLTFSEFHQGVGVTEADNGLPYMVKDMLVPVKPYTVSDMYELKDYSRLIDEYVSDYMSLKLPQPPRGPVMGVLNRHVVFSPFFNKIIADIRAGILVLPNRVQGFEKQEVLKICKSYETWLEWDPIRSPNLQDTRFVLIHPHGYDYYVGVNANTFRFLQKVAEYYGDNLIQLAPYLKIV